MRRWSSERFGVAPRVNFSLGARLAVTMTVKGEERITKKLFTRNSSPRPVAWPAAIYRGVAEITVKACSRRHRLVFPTNFALGTMNQLGRCIHMLAGALILALAGTLHSQTTIQVASGLSNPLYVTAPPADPNRLFIVEQGVSGSARIKILDLTNNTVNTTPFLTIDDLWTGGEQGLLGMAFDPNYATNGKFYVNVTAPLGRFDAGVTEIRQYTVSANPDISETTFTTVLSLDKPQTNHNGGWIGFSPRAGETNNLYIAMGDGGKANDQGLGHGEPGGNAQNTGSLFGKILRIQVDPATGRYTIPANNPFGNEVFTYGLRNPFRVSFDRQTGDMLIGDVGQGSREEIDRQLASNPNGGENYGWRLREGTIQTPGSVGGPPPSGSVEPILDYDRNVGTTITGGYVYRGRLASQSRRKIHLRRFCGWEDFHG
jgi:glucose/arabinose dehydrogenase